MKFTFKEAVTALKAHALPDDFDQWFLADDNGWTVAHIAAWLNLVPVNFDHWHLQNNFGKTVQDIFDEVNELSR